MITKIAFAGVLIAGVFLQRASAAKPQPVGARHGDLAAAVRSADEIRVLAPGSREVLRILKAVGLGEEFLRQFAINEDAPHFHCMCLGEAWLEFRTAGTVKATVGFHHARSIRWHDGPWTTDAELTGNDGVKLSQWFQAKGFVGFEERRLADLRWMQEWESGRRQFSDQLPVEMKAVLFADDAGFDTEYIYARRALERSSGRPSWIAAAFRAFGQQPFEDRGFDAEMSLTCEFVRRAAAQDVAAALDLSKSDPAAMRGAAFLFARDWLPLTDPQQDIWWPILADFVLQHAADGLKQDALRRLVWSKAPNASELLAAIATGRKSYSYSAHRAGERNGEPDLVAAACLGLAMKEDSRASTVLRDLEGRYEDGPSKAALRLTRCLIHKEADFDPASFKYFSFLLGYAGLKVLRDLPTEKVPAAHLAAALDAPWGAVREEAEVFASKLGLKGTDDIKLESNFHELNPPTRLAQKNPAMAISVFSEMLPNAKGETVKTLREYRGRAFMNLGRNAEAVADFRAAQEIEYDRQLREMEASALWRSGDCKAAIRLLSAVTPLTDNGQRETRGFAYFASEDHEKCEADLAPVVAFFPSDYRTVSVHHVAACLSGKPEFSQISRAISAAESWDDQRFAALLPRFWASQVSEEQLLERAQHPPKDSDESVVENQALAYFSASQKARLDKDNSREIGHLEHVIALNQFSLAEHWLAHARLNVLRGGKSSTSSSAATDAAKR